MSKTEAGDRRPCKGCGATIAFIKDKDGVLHPLDMQAPVYVIEGDLMGVQVAVRADAYVSHFATCVKRDDFSASRGSR